MKLLPVGELKHSDWDIVVEDGDSVEIDRLILAGASPRGMSALMRAARIAAWLEGRDHVLPEDVQAVYPSTMIHRLFFTPIYELRRAEIAPALIEQILNRVAAP